MELKGKEQADPFSKISDRELEVLRLVGEGRSTREIAQYLNLSKKTIESHRLHLRDKLELKSAAELIRFALDWHGGKMPPFQPMDASSAAAPVMIG